MSESRERDPQGLAPSESLAAPTPTEPEPAQGLERDGAEAHSEPAKNPVEPPISNGPTEPTSTPGPVEPPPAEVSPLAPVGLSSATLPDSAQTVPPARRVVQDELWGSLARSVALAAVLGFAVGAWVKLAVAGSMTTELLAQNLVAEGDRGTFLKFPLIGALLFALAASGWLASRWRKPGEERAAAWSLTERWLWFASPLMLAPALSSVLRYKPWVNEHARLLPIVLFLGLVMEVLVFKSLVAAPEAARRWWRDMLAVVPDLVRRRAPLVLVLTGSLFYVLFFSFYLVRWHYKMRTGNFDLSINNNLMFGGLHGHFLESTVVFPQDPPKYLANHAKFGGYLFLPIYALFPRPETLLVIQSTFIGASAIPLFAFARRHIHEWLAAIVALAYLVYYPMHGASFSEFQYVPIAAFFILGVIWAAETRRYILLTIIFLVGMTMREDIPIGMAVVGAFLLLSGHRPIPGLVIALVASVYFVVLRFYVMDSAGEWWFPNMYKELWADGEKGFRSVIKTLLSNPLFVLSKIVVEKKLVYLMHLLVPLAFLPVRRWYLWAAFIPGTLLTLLITNYDPPVTFSFHYVMHWAPYIFVAAVLALKSLGQRPDFGFERKYAAAAALAMSSLVLTYNYGAFTRRAGSFKGGFQKVDFEITDAERDRLKRLRELIAMVPKDASLAATEKIGPHASSRLEMYTMRNGPQDAEYVLASSRELKLSRTKPKLLEALRNGDYGVLKRSGDLALLKRDHDTSENERLIRDWRLSDGRPPPAAAQPEAPPPPREPEGKPPEEEADPRGPE